MSKNLKIINMVLTGKVPVKDKILFEDVIAKGDMYWQIINEDRSPILTTRIYREKDDINIQGKRKSIYVSLFNSGHININGAKSMKEAEEVFNRIIQELSKIIKMEVNQK